MATKKKKKSKTKKPTDLQITRKNSKFTFKWKTGEKYEGQSLRYRVKGPNGWFNWIPRNLPAKTASLTIELPLNQIAPDGMKIHAVQFKAQGWAKDKPDSEWNSCTYTLKKPNKPSLSMSILSQESASFTFSAVADKTKPEAFERTEYMTALSGGTATPTWSAPVNGGASGTLTYRENSTQVASGSHTRWFRVRARGYRGDTEWVTSKRVYAKPRPANIIKTSYTQDGSGVHGWFQWNSSYDTAYPIDSTSAEYVEVVPDANVSLPAGELQWKSAGGLSGARATDSVSFDIDHAIDDDKVVFVRVNTTHENWTTNSVPKILVKGNLAAPDAPVLSDQDPEQYTVTVTADNNSEVADSFLVVSYKSDTQSQIDIGIIPHGQSSVNVRCPAWGSENKSFGVRAVVGSYTKTVRADNVRIYNVSASMTSKGIRWTDGNLPVAPGNVTVTATDVVGSVRVGWKWSWSKADSAEIAWSDHEDAWESTDEPESYIVSNLHASQWNIAGLELGKTWHVRVRLIDGSGEDDVKGPWSPIEHIDLASAPAIPILTLSSEKELNGQKMSVITMDDILTAYWSYITTDGSGQAYAEICEAEIVDGTIEYGRVIAKTESAQHIDIDPKDPLIGWSAGDTKLLCVRVASGSGKSSPGWSAPVSVSVADPITAQITETSLVDEEIVENPQTYTGDIVSFESENLAPEARSLTVSLSPIQSLNGYDKPWSGGNGKNKLNVASGSGSEVRGVTPSYDGAGGLHFTGTTSEVGYCGSWTFANPTVLTAGTYTFSIKESTGWTISLLNNWANVAIISGTENSQVFTVSQDTPISRITMTKSGQGEATIDVTFKELQIESGSSATSYAPYSNICPISGHTSVETHRAGKNLLPAIERTITSNGITAIVNTNDWTVTLNGSNPNGNSWINIDYVSDASSSVFDVQGLVDVPLKAVWDDAPTLTSGNMTFQVGAFTADSWRGRGSVYNARPTLEFSYQEGDLYGRSYLQIPQGNSFNNLTIRLPMICLASDSDNVEPYNGNTYTTALGRTVYGGTLDVVSGVLTVDRAMTTFVGTESWYLSNGGMRAYCQSSIFAGAKPNTGNKSLVGLTSNQFVEKTPNNTWDGGVDNIGISLDANKQFCVCKTGQKNMVVADWKAYLTSNPLQVCYELATPQTIQLTPQEVNLLLGNNNVWSDGKVTLTTADAIIQAKALKKLPLTITVTGAGNGGTTTVAIERFGARSTDNRPDERTYDGFDGETVALIDQTGEAQISIDRNSDELFGVLDDGAWYRIVATAEDALGQTSTATQEFIVDWTHQAVVPDADIEVLEQNVVKIKPKLPAELPDGWTFDEGDSCDIYRLTADLPELIVEGAQFGTEYVDPYPAIGEFGGHRLVYRTAEGDYTTPDNSIAWYDTGEDEGDTIESDAVLIDFNGTQIALRYNLDLSNSWEKDFRETRYLGGSIQGDWNEGVSRSSSVSAITVSFTDPDTIRMMRRLAEYAGVCHVRTLDGSSFPCDIQVSENREQGGYNKLVRFSLSITRVDAEEYEGMTYADWREQNGLE